MTQAVFGSDPVTREVELAIEALRDGLGRDAIRETPHVDLKEDPSRRDHHGNLLEPQSRSEQAANFLASEAACMANTDGGGALIVGVTDDGTPLGTQLEAEWLRSRIYDLTERRLTVDVRVVDLNGVRLLVVRSLQAIEPIRWRNRTTWRVDDRCVEMDATTWHARRMSRERYDWSEQSSSVEAREARPTALEIARQHLRNSGERHAMDLAGVSDQELLRRLNVISLDGFLTNAGVLAFVGRGDPALDYIRRTQPAGDSRRRVRLPNISLLEELDTVETAIDAFNEDRHIQRGLVIGRLKELPPLTIREALVNGVVHRDWASPAPTLVEHTGRMLAVTSPGGFIGGITPQNIITHPSQPRNRALAELFASLRIAEREGIGVDRMVRDMIAVGYPPPVIAEIEGPYVRAALLGESLDEAWIRFLSRLTPDESRESLTNLLLLRHSITYGWFDVATVAPVLQLNEAESAGHVHNLCQITIDGHPIVSDVAGVPRDAPPAWCLSEKALKALAEEDSAVNQLRDLPDRRTVAMNWAHTRGRISSTELASMFHVKPPAMNRILKSLQADGLLQPSRESSMGRSFHYQPMPKGQ